MYYTVTVFASYAIQPKMYTLYEMLVYKSTCSVLTAIAIITDYTHIGDGSRREFVYRRIQEK